MHQLQINHVTQQQLANNQVITKKSVMTSYKAFQKQSSIDDTDALRIIHILGGIDTILDEFFCETHGINMLPIQLNQLNQLFVTPHKHQQQNKDSSLTKLYSLSRNETYTKHDEMYHEFDTTHSYLHDIWGHKFATNAMRTLHQKWPHILFFVILGLHMVLRFVFPEHIIYPLYTFIFCGVVTHFYVVLWLLSANKKGLQLVLRTFEFWLKVGYIIVGTTLALVIEYGIDGALSMDYGYFRLGTSIVMFSNVIFMVIVMSVFDALNVNRASKAIFSTTMAIGATIMVIYQQYTTYFNGTESEIYVADGRSLSLLSLQQNAMEVIALFSWKQAIFTLVKKDRCVLIKYSPYIEWIESKQNDDQSMKAGYPTQTVNGPEPIDINMDDENSIENQLNTANGSDEPRTFDLDDIHMTRKNTESSISASSQHL